MGALATSSCGCAIILPLPCPPKYQHMIGYVCLVIPRIRHVPVDDGIPQVVRHSEVSAGKVVHEFQHRYWDAAKADITYDDYDWPTRLNNLPHPIQRAEHSITIMAEGAFPLGADSRKTFQPPIGRYSRHDIIICRKMDLTHAVPTNITGHDLESLHAVLGQAEPVHFERVPTVIIDGPSDTAAT